MGGTPAYCKLFTSCKDQYSAIASGES